MDARAALLIMPLLLTACLLDGDPTRRTQRRARPHEIHPAQSDPLLSGRRSANGGGDRFSMDAALPRSGDPTRPNVKVSLSVSDVVSNRGLQLTGSVSGSLVQGVLDLSASISAGGSRNRARSQTTSFIVVQVGHEASIFFNQQTRYLIGRYNGMRVRAVNATTQGITLELAPFVATTAVPGETLSGATRVTIRSGQAVVIGGLESSSSRSSRGFLGGSSSSQSRRLLALLQADVLR